MSSEVPSILEHRVGDYTVSNDPARLDPARIHAFLTKIYWAEGVALATVQRSLRHCFNIGVYAADGQVGLTRIITDFTTFAYLTDVYVEAAHERKGLAAAMVRFALVHPDLQNLRRFLLVSRDAQGLYERFGFTAPKNPERFMELLPRKAGG
jgi:ribosomal protein S18 acetylase RimI-like enzyme